MSNIQFPSPAKEIILNEDRVQYARLSLSYHSETPTYFFEDGRDTQTGDFDDILFLLNEFGKDGWDTAFKENNHTIYLRRFYKQ